MASFIAPLEDINRWVDFWYYIIGCNVIPANTKLKKTFIQWKQYQGASIPEEQIAQWKSSNAFRDGMAILPGKVWRGDHIGEHLVFVDLDNAKSIAEFCRYFTDSKGEPATLQQLAEKFIIEQH